MANISSKNIPFSSGSAGHFRVEIDANAAKILNLAPDFLQQVINNWIRVVEEKRLQLILDQFIDFSGPGQRSDKVINRSGKLKKSIRLDVIIRRNQVFFKATYDKKYQTVQPLDNRKVVKISAKEKNYLAIPNENIGELFNSDGSYKFAGIPLDDPRNPFSIQSKKLYKSGKTLRKRSGANKGMVYYFLKKSVKIVAKRPIFVADQALMKQNQKLLNASLQQAFRDNFILGI